MKRPGFSRTFWVAGLYVGGFLLAALMMWDHFFRYPEHVDQVDESMDIYEPNGTVDPFFESIRDPNPARFDENIAAPETTETRSKRRGSSSGKMIESMLQALNDPSKTEPPGETVEDIFKMLSEEPDPVDLFQDGGVSE